jgi:hypothetical protein
MTKTQESADPRVRAAQSAGRAAGYCWMKHPTRGQHCTRPVGHTGDHKHYYARLEWK